MAIRVQLKPKHDKRVRAGHPWVFSNEVDGDVKAMSPGAVADVFDAKGAFMGRGFANPNSLVCVRIVSRRRQEDLDNPVFFAERLRAAVAYRQAVYPHRRSLRLVHDQGDGLPGLTIDRYGDVLAVSIETPGVEVRKEQLHKAIVDVLDPAGVILLNDSRMRVQEGLDAGCEVWFGDVPDEIRFTEHDVTYMACLHEGVKSGRHYFDQADNRAFAMELCRDKAVLDVYANAGQFGIAALTAGASEALVVDKFEPNAQLACANAELNGVGDRMEAWAGEGKAAMQELIAEGRRFGVVILDPPPFAKAKKAANSALKGYEEVNTMAMTLVEPEGFLMTGTRSHPILEERFVEMLGKAAKASGRSLRRVRSQGAAMDHPIQHGVGDTVGLKHQVFQVRMGV